MVTAERAYLGWSRRFLRARARSAAVAGFLAGALATQGCQTEPGDDEGSTGDGGAALGSLYPLVPGATWTYLDSYSDAADGRAEVVTVKVADPQVWGEGAYILSDSPDETGEWTESVIRRQDGAAKRVHKTVHVDQTPTQRVEYDPGFMRADDAWIAQPVGFQVEHDYLRTASDRPDDPEMRVHSYTIAAKNEVVEVPAGTFECIKIIRERRSGATKGEIVEFWYAPGVGKVKEFRPHEGSFEVLSSWSIPEQD